MDIKNSMKYGESINDEIVDGFEIDGDLSDIAKKAVRENLAMKGGSRFMVSDLAASIESELTDWKPNGEQQDNINEEFARRKARAAVGTLKSNGKRALRLLRTGKPVSESVRDHAILQVSQECGIRLRWAKHVDIHDAYTYWKDCEALRNIVASETDKDFRSAIQMDFEVIGEMFE